MGRCKATVEGRDLLVNERNVQRQTNTHHMVTEEDAPQENPKFFFGCIPTHCEPTQPKHLIRQLSRDTTLPISENTQKRAFNDHNTSIDRLVEAIARIASQQPTTSATLNPASTNIL